MLEFILARLVDTMAKTKTEPAVTTPQTRVNYTVVARRYRPQQFKDLIGQEHIATAMANAIKTGRIAHAYLFTGARGVGKTSCARILAKALNCVHGPTATPCDQCDICKSIATGDDIDAVEIDGASNNKVDEARDLRSNVGFRPQRARYKIYIIDEVHMLSTSAFNALLKTLEEPPPHVKFILATTEVHKLPITILSRCQRYDFALIGPKRVFDTLKAIVAQEGIEAEEAALQLLARRANGSMRDAQTLLDQLIGSGEGPLTLTAIQHLLGTASDDRIAELAAAILDQDMKRGIEICQDAYETGLQLSELLDQLIDYWRGLMLVLAGGPATSDLPGTPALQEHIRAQAGRTTLDTVLAGLDILATAKSRLRSGVTAMVVVEMTVVRLCQLDQLLSVATLTRMLAEGNGGSNTPIASIAQTISQASVKKNSLTPETSLTNGSRKLTSTEPEADVDVGELSLPEIWERVLREVGQLRAVQLAQAEMPATFGPNALAIRFPASYSSAYDAIASEAGLEALRRAFRKVTGQDWAIRVEQVAMPTVPTEELPKSIKERKAELMQRPLFVHANQLFGTSPQNWVVDEGFDPRPNADTSTDLDLPVDPDEG